MANEEPLHPGMNSRLHTLTLTSLPRWATKEFVATLFTFLQHAEVQERNISIARSHISHYRAPPLLSGLRILRLEFLPEKHKAPASVSGDVDADTYHQNSASDFSFFSDNDAAPADVISPLRQATHINVVEDLKKWRKYQVPYWRGNIIVVPVDGV